MIEVRHLSVGYASRPIIDDLSFDLAEGQWLMILGPNGSGKTTLVQALTGRLDFQGQIQILGKNLKEIKDKDRGRMIGLLAQSRQASFDYTVEEVVELGRYPYQDSWFSGATAEDQAIIEETLQLTDLDRLRDQSILNLSGGELQRVYLAQLFVQNPQIMILDEPSNHLDLSFELQFYEMVDAWRKKPHRSVISIMHDLSLAQSYGDLGILLDRDHNIYQGSMSELFSRDRLQTIYGIDVVELMQDRYQSWMTIE